MNNATVWSVEPSAQRYSYYADFPFFRKSNDYHEQYAVYFLEAGSFAYRIGSGAPEILDKGELIICPPHTNFSKTVRETVTMHLINLDFEDEAEIPCCRFNYADDRRIVETLARLRGLLSQRELPTERYRRHLVDDLWYSICARIESPFVIYETHASDPLSREINAYIANHLDTSLAELTEVFRCSRVTVNNCFRRYTGDTVGEYIRKARIEEACRMIAQTNEPFKALAPACGFSSEYYFSSVFHRSTGCTPGEYRRMCRNKADD